MTDRELIELFWERQEEALKVAQETYGPYCGAIAGNILHSREDVEECLNDTWLRLWNAIPPQRPEKLGIFAGKITRNLAFDRVKAQRAEKRGGDEIELILEELGECIAGSDSVESQIITRELEKSMNDFVGKLPQKERNVFLRRYYFAERTEEIARRYGYSSNYVLVLLHRSRRKLKAYLTKEGYFP